MRCLTLLPVVALVLVACSDAPASTEPETPLFSTTNSLGYTAISLGTLGGPYSDALDINDAGQVVGHSSTASGETHAFLWDGEMHDLGTLGGTSSEATAINCAGHVAGSSETASGETHAFFWDGEMHDLGTLGTWSSARDVNCAGQVAGNSETASGEKHAFLWDGEMRDLGTLGGKLSEVTFWNGALNDAGQVAGASETASGEVHAFLWDGEMYDLGTLGAASCPRDINENGQVAGYSFTADALDAFLWDGVMYDLGEGDAHGMNDAGQVVGWCKTGSGETQACLWDGGVVHELGIWSGSFSFADDINEVGQVLIRNFPPSGGELWLWDKGVMQYLGKGQPYDLNNTGQVVGNSILGATLWRRLTPVEHLESCAALVSDLEAQDVLNKGQAQSFVNKINVATAMLNDGKKTPAINMLEAFQNEASGYVNGGNITAEQGEELVSCVQVVIDAAGGS